MMHFILSPVAKFWVANTSKGESEEASQQMWLNVTWIKF